MKIKLASVEDADSVYSITTATISSIYPYYYPNGAVDFFLAHHRIENILLDIDKK